MRLLACLIVAPQRGYDEPAILSYAISSFCPTSADGLQFSNQRRTGPEVIGVLGQQVPAQHHEFAGDRHHGDLLAAVGPNTKKESMEWPRRLGRGPRRLDQHGARMCPAMLPCWAKPGRIAALGD